MKSLDFIHFNFDSKILAN